jgi:hypothetical protein
MMPIAFIEAASPLDLAGVSYRYRPPRSKTEYVSQPEQGPEETRYRKLFKSSVTRALALHIKDQQLKGIQEYQTKGYNASSALKSHDQGGLLRRGDVINLKAQDEEWEQIRKKWEEEFQKVFKKKTQEYYKNRRALELVNNKYSWPQNRTPELTKEKKDLEWQISYFEKEVAHWDGNVLKPAALRAAFNATPLGTSFGSMTGSFDINEIESAINNGHRSMEIWRLMRSVKEPTMAQYSRDFDTTLATAIYDLFYIQRKYLNRRSIMKQIETSGPKQIQNIVNSEMYDAIELLSYNEKDDQGKINKEVFDVELFSLLISGYEIDRIRRELIGHGIETMPKKGRGYDTIYDNKTITDGIKRIYNNLGKYFGQAETEEIDSLKSEWHDPNELFKTPEFRAQLERALVNPDQPIFQLTKSRTPCPRCKSTGKTTYRPERGEAVVETCRDCGGTGALKRPIWDLPRETGDERRRPSEIRDDLDQNREIPNFIWIIVTGLEEAGNKGVEVDDALSRAYGQPVAICPECNRSPAGLGDLPCTTCGYAKEAKRDPSEIGLVECPSCEGTKQDYRKAREIPLTPEQQQQQLISIMQGENKCPECGGTGKVKETEAGVRATGAAPSRSSGRDIGTGVVPAWYWANERGYPAHVDFKGPEEERTPFEKIFQIVWNTFGGKYKIEPYDGFVREQDSNKGIKVVDQNIKFGEVEENNAVFGVDESSVPKPWLMNPPRGQRRPTLAENTMSYTTIFKLFLPGMDKIPVDYSYPEKLQAVREKIADVFRNIVKKDLAKNLEEKQFFIELFDRRTNLNRMAVIKASKIEMGYEELIGKGKDWSDPNQPSTYLVKDAFKLYRMGTFLERIEMKSPYLFKAIGLEDKAYSKYGLKELDFIGCLKRSFKHLASGLSYDEELSFESWGKSDDRKRAMLKAKSSFPGQEKLLTELQEIIRRAEIYKYSRNNRLPERMMRFMRAQASLQSIYDSHVLGMPFGRDPEAEKLATKLGIPITTLKFAYGKSDNPDHKEEGLPAGFEWKKDAQGRLISDQESGKAHPGVLRTRGPYSKREGLLVVARRIQQILEHANVQHRQESGDKKYWSGSWAMPHYLLYMALGLTYAVPDRFVGNLIRSGLYNIVNTKYYDEYAEYLTETHDIENPAENQPDNIKDIAAIHNVDLSNVDTLKAFFCAQKPQLVLVYLEAAIGDIKTILKEDKSLDDIDILLQKSGNIIVGNIVNEKENSVTIRTKKSAKVVSIDKLRDVGCDPDRPWAATATLLLKKYIGDIAKYLNYASQRLSDKSVKRKIRSAEARKKNEIQLGVDQGDFQMRKSFDMQKSIAKIMGEKRRGKADVKKVLEAEIFLMLQAIIYKGAGSAYWNPRGNTYDSFMNIKDQFVEWFKRTFKSKNGRPVYANLDLDIGGLLTSGIDFGHYEEDGLEILTNMRDLLQKWVGKKDVEQLNRMRQVADDILAKK